MSLPYSTQALDELFHQSSPSALKTGVLITNLGTPDAPTAPALRRYLAEFLSDPRVVEIPKILWMLILHGIILRIRPAKSAAKYQTVWTERGSPLLAISQDQAAAIQTQLGGLATVKLAMRYGNPSIKRALQEFRAQGINRLIVLPLYPQYSGATTGSTFDAITKELTQWRWVPELHFLSSYCDSPSYINALAASVQEYINEKGMPDKLVFSYHGMPKRTLDLGDPYFCLCQKTTRLVVEKLNLPKENVATSFQSRFGKAEWLKPYTDETLRNLAREGVKKVAVLAPAFSADCLETLEEIAMENRDEFLHAGGESYDYIPALNTREDHIDALASLLKKHI